MTTRYKIIWIDDQYDEQESFIDQADREGFEIQPFKTSREGMEYLRKNLHDVDAVILDAKVFKDSTEEVPTTKGLGASLAELAKMSGMNNLRDIPHVIFTGQPDLIGDSNFEDMVDEVAIFSKLRSNDELFQSLRQLISGSRSMTIRNRYPAAHAACEWMGGDGWRMLFPILNSMGSGVELITDPYNDLRKVTELAFRKLHEAGILHERLIENGELNLVGSSYFLAGLPAKFGRTGAAVKAKAGVIPKLVGEQIRFVLNVCQVGSHTEGNHEISESKPSIMEVERWNKSHNLLEIATLMTLDFIVWAKAYVDESPDPRINISNWEPISQSEISSLIEVEGEVISVNRGGNAFVKPDHLEETDHKNICIGNRLVKNNELVIGVRVRATTSGKQLDNGALAAESYVCL